MKYVNNVKYDDNGFVEMTLDLVDYAGVRQTVNHQICNLQDEAVKKILVGLGWSTPEQTAKLKNSFMACDLNYIHLEGECTKLKNIISEVKAWDIGQAVDTFVKKKAPMQMRLPMGLRKKIQESI